MKNGDKPAFPEWDLNEKGLTKREYFAAKAMEGLLSSMTEKGSSGTWDSEHEYVAKVAVKFADELIKALDL